MTIRSLILITILLSVLLCRSVSAQTTIVLRHAADLTTAPEDAPLRLADIAELSGPDADRFGSLVVVPDPRRAAGAGAAVEVSVAEVRRVLDATGTVNWGRVALSGASCTVRLSSPVSPSPNPIARTRNVPEPLDDSGPPTVKSLLGARLAEHYSVDLSDLRLGFDPSDAEFLSLSAVGRRVDLSPSAGPGSAKMPVEVIVYEKDRIVVSRVVSVSVLLNRPVITAVRVIDRGQALGDGDIAAQKQWLPPGGRALAGIDQARTSTAANRINAGQVIAEADLTSPIVVKRGDIVYVHAVTGSVVVKAKARALGTARDGEIVQLKLDGSDNVFGARMSGRGRAVMLVPDSDTREDRGPQTSTSRREFGGLARAEDDVTRPTHAKEADRWR